MAERKNKSLKHNSGFARFGWKFRNKNDFVLSEISNKIKNWEWLSPNLAKPQNVKRLKQIIYKNMNLMQSKLEQVFKEYIIFKEYIGTNQKSQEELRTEVASIVAQADNEDDSYLEVLFKNIGEKSLEAIDLNQLATRFKYYYEAYKDFIETPQEIKTEAEKIQIKFLYSIQNGEKVLVDKELYDNYKKQFLEANKQMN